MKNKISNQNELQEGLSFYNNKLHKMFGRNLNLPKITNGLNVNYEQSKRVEDNLKRIIDKAQEISERAGGVPLDDVYKTTGFEPTSFLEYYTEDFKDAAEALPPEEYANDVIALMEDFSKPENKRGLKGRLKRFGKKAAPFLAAGGLVLTTALTAGCVGEGNTATRTNNYSQIYTQNNTVYVPSEGVNGIDIVTENSLGNYSLRDVVPIEFLASDISSAQVGDSPAEITEFVLEKAIEMAEKKEGIDAVKADIYKLPRPTTNAVIYLLNKSKDKQIPVEKSMFTRDVHTYKDSLRIPAKTIPGSIHGVDISTDQKHFVDPPKSIGLVATPENIREYNLNIDGKPVGPEYLLAPTEGGLESARQLYTNAIIIGGEIAKNHFNSINPPRTDTLKVLLSEDNGITQAELLLLGINNYNIKANIEYY